VSEIAPISAPAHVAVQVCIYCDAYLLNVMQYRCDSYSGIHVCLI